MTRLPKYRRHPNGQAFLAHNSVPAKDHRLYLGLYGSEESKLRYERFIARLVARDSAPPPNDQFDYCVNELIVKYTDWAESYYSCDGKTTREFDWMVYALKPLAELFGDQYGRDILPHHLLTIQQHLIRRDYARTVINGCLNRIKRFFRWCCKHGYLPADQHYQLLCVDGLRKGRCGAREPKPVLPVGRDAAFAVLPFVSPQIGAMIQVQYYCGMRPGEVVIMRRADIDTSDEVWLFRPQKHKTEHLGNSLVKAIPLVAQQLLGAFFQPDLDAYLFSPRHAEFDRRQKLRASRKTPMTPSQRSSRVAKPDPKKPVGDAYTTKSYYRAIQRGIQKANDAGVEIPRWHPNQLRHSIATEVSQRLGQQAAQRWLGHADLNTTDLYVEAEVSELIEIARRLNQVWAG